MRNEAEPRVNIIDLPSQRPLIIGNNALKAEYWENPVHISVQIIDLERYRNNPLKKQIDYFDNNWQQEELPQDWYRVDDIGFSSKRQMRLLREEGDVNKWAEQTGRDLLGFALEYLRQGTVFPFEYQIEGDELVDKKYGDRKMTNTVDQRERGGAVFESLIRIQEYLLEAEEGSTAIMVSPPGHTGLIMDDGSSIVYTDTMIFHMRKEGDKIIGTTIRTDFNLVQARELIKQLTGQELPQNATVVDCTKALALLDGVNLNSSKNAEALVDILQSIKGSIFSYQDRTWNSTRLDIQRRNELYYFDQITHAKIDEFKEYITTGVHPEEEIQKALAATFLIISKHLLVDKPNPQNNDQARGLNVDIYPEYKSPTMGAIINKVKALPGCMGGGRVTSIKSMMPRSVTVEDDWSDKSKRKYDKPGPCLTCGRDVPCGPCKMCKSCNDNYEMLEVAA